MWNLIKPKLPDALSDIKDFKTKGIISINDYRMLKILTCRYDSQKGNVYTEQHNRVSLESRQSLLKHYRDTYHPGPLYNIRRDLYCGVNKCPYCHVGEPSTLDHYMPKSKYPALSLCRLNLIPACGTCNNHKGYSQDPLEFVHPYYPHISADKTFLKCEIRIVHGTLVVLLSLNEGVLRKLGVYERFMSHWINLKLGERLRNASISFIQNNISPLVVDVEDLCIYIEDQLIRHKRNISMANDWRTVILESLHLKLQSNEKEQFAETILNMNKKNQISKEYGELIISCC